MASANRPHPFHTGKQLKERRALLACWLNPDSPESMVVNGVPPSSKQLADALSKHFNIRPLSPRSVLRYVKEASETVKNQQLSKRGRGRPANSNLENPAITLKRTRGRPRKVATRAEEDLITEAVQIKRPPARSISEKAQRAKLYAQLAAEAVQLTGLSPNALHKAFSGQTTWRSFLGERSSFFYRLQKTLTANHLASDKSSLRSDADLDHSLRLHQINLHTIDGLWCAILFGYETRSHFLNAACYVTHPKTTDSPTGRLSGRPVKQFHPTWRATFTQENGQTKLHLPAETLLEFAIETRALMGVPVDTVWLSSSLGNQATLISQLQQLAPEGRFLAIRRPHQPFILPEAGKSIRVTALCRQLEAVLNSHYQEVAFAALDEYQSRIDQRIEEVFHIKKLTSGRQRYKQRNLITTLGESNASKARRQQAKELAEFRTSVQERLHVKHCLSIDTVHLTCDIR